MQTQIPNSIRSTVPGMNIVLGPIYSGAVILIKGAPGSGKTRLALQMMAQYTSSSPNFPPYPVFVSFDEPKADLENMLKAMRLDHKVRIEYIPSQCGIAEQRLAVAGDQAGQITKKSADRSEDEQKRRAAQKHKRTNEGERMRAEARKILKEAISEKLGLTESDHAAPAATAICFDGLLNLPEIRAGARSQRREALYRMVSMLRDTMSHADSGPFFSIITMEDDPGDTQGLVDSEYLSDVVIQLSTSQAQDGFVHRTLALLKSRSGTGTSEALIGSHSFEILAPKQVEERTQSNRFCGWQYARTYLNVLGVVVYPTRRPAMPALMRKSQLLREIHGDAIQNVCRFITHLPESRFTSTDLWKFLELDITYPGHIDVGWLDNALKELVSLAKRYASGGGSELSAAAKVAQEALPVVLQVLSLFPKATAVTPSRARSFGITNLDELLSPVNSGTGHLHSSSTAMLGPIGSGKSLVAQSFILAGIRDNEHVVSMNFKQRPRQIIYANRWLQIVDRQGGHFRYRDHIPERIFKGNLYNPSLPQFRLIYENPLGFDFSRILEYLRVEMERILERGPDHSLRLVIDGASDLLQFAAHPAEWISFIAKLLRMASEADAMLLMILDPTINSISPSLQDFVCGSVDNVVQLGLVRVNDASRRSISISKSRGHPQASGFLELVFNRSDDGGVNLDVQPGFDGMSNVWTGNPVAARIELRLHSESNAQLSANQKLVERLTRKFGEDRILFTPLDLADADREVSSIEDGRNIRPDADVALVSLDEPWVESFRTQIQQHRSHLAVIRESSSRRSFRSLLRSLLPKALETAACHTDEPVKSAPVVGTASQMAIDPILPTDRAWIAVPYSIDMGLLLMREDLLEGCADPLVLAIPLTDKTDPKTSLEGLIQTYCGGNTTKVGFAFDMMCDSTVACTLIELAWCFGASEQFLASGDPQDADALVEALCFLRRIRRKKLMPYPCTLAECAEALFVRTWYANISDMVQGNQEARFRHIPFVVGKPLSTVYANSQKRVVTVLEGAVASMPIPGSEPASSQSPPGAISEGETGKAGGVIFQRPHGPAGGQDCVACSGSWYLGVSAEGANKTIGWEIVQDVMSHERILERAGSGAALPSVGWFYQSHKDKPVVGISNLTYGKLLSLFSAARPRVAAFRTSGSPAKGATFLQQRTGELADLFRETVGIDPAEDLVEPSEKAHLADRKMIQEHVLRYISQLSGRAS